MDHILSRNKSTTLSILVNVWFLYLLFVISSYECNLRAYILAKDYEVPPEVSKVAIDSSMVCQSLQDAVDFEQDILDQGKRLFVPNGTLQFVNVYK